MYSKTIRDRAIIFDKIMAQAMYELMYKNNYMLKETKTGQTIPFLLNSTQELIIKDMLNNKKNIVDSPRQMGNSTLLCAYIAKMLSMQADFNDIQIFLCCANNKNCLIHLDIIKTFLKQDTIEYDDNTISTIKTKNGFIKYVLSLDDLKGYTPSILICIDCDFFDFDLKSIEIFNCQVMLLSTKSPFYDTAFKKILKTPKRYNFNKRVLYWMENPDYNTELEWVYVDNFGNLKRTKEDEYTRESYELKLSKGYKPLSPWFLKRLEMMGEESMSYETITY